MSDWQLKTPVVLLVFKRPDTTEKVFEAVRQAKPPKLLVVADGARADRPGEAEKCEAVQAIMERVDWDCQVLKNYSSTNLGCMSRVSSGLDWVFNTVEEAIILEDDCVPNLDFFRFCEELLERYRADERIMSISGLSIPVGHRRSEESYHFSIYNRCWGWASWRRAWKYYDREMKLWPEIKAQGFLEDILRDSQTVEYWTKIFQSTYEGEINSWAYRWTFACWIQNGLSILPSVNLVTNIGFGIDATHTTTIDSNSRRANLPLEAVKFPLQHPPFVVRDAQADKYLQENVHNPTLMARAKNKVKKLLRL